MGINGSFGKKKNNLTCVLCFLLKVHQSNITVFCFPRVVRVYDYSVDFVSRCWRIFQI